MKNTNEIKNVLDFYAKSDKLRNIIIEDTNYSIADHIYGSMVLATAINSEFKETNDLPKIYRMLFLMEFCNLYPSYDFNKLKFGEQYLKEANEAKKAWANANSPIFKYKMLDFLLTDLISEEEKNSPEKLQDKGSKYISSILNKNPSECKEIFNFYYYNFKLKNKVRTGWDQNHWNIKSDRLERISEHVVDTIGLSLVIDSEFGYDTDIDTILTMLVIHEIGESIIGDITPFDGITPEEKQEIEHKAMRTVLGELKDKNYLYKLLLEFDDKKTLEAKYAHYIDKIVADIKSKLLQEKGLHHSLDDQENNVVFNSKKVQQMIKDGATTAFDIWYEWDKTIYENDKQFPAFANILKMARDIKITNIDNTITKKTTPAKVKTKKDGTLN